MKYNKYQSRFVRVDWRNEILYGYCEKVKISHLRLRMKNGKLRCPYFAKIKSVIEVDEETLQPINVSF